MFAAITAFAGSYDGGLTVALVATQLVLVTCYLAAVRPQETRGANQIELTSEVLLTHCFFCVMVCLSTAEPTRQYFIAWLCVATISTLVVVCVVYLASDSVTCLLRWVRIRLAKRRRLAEQERIRIVALQESNEVPAVTRHL